MSSRFGVVVAGAGQAGVQVALSLREYGYNSPILLLDCEADEPYRRPPLSKGYLKGDMDRSQLAIRSPKAFADKTIELRCGTAVVGIDRAASSVNLSDGSTVRYENLVLALGGTNRSLPGGLPSFLSLRTRSDADQIRAAITTSAKIAIIGGGFVGLEVAASLQGLGCEVLNLERETRVLSRVVSVEISEHLARLHRDKGTVINLGVDRLSWELLPSGKTMLNYGNDQAYEADAVIVGIGIEPNVRLAKEAGLKVADGIVVDAHLTTSDPEIFAIGDCARFPDPETGEPVRIESVQNATDQGRVAASNIAGNPTKYKRVPWFWSDQYDTKLQIVGRTNRSTTRRIVGTKEKFSVLCFEGDRLVGVESINAAADHMAARKLLESGRPISLHALSEQEFDLVRLAKAVQAQQA